MLKVPSLREEQYIINFLSKGLDIDGNLPELEKPKDLKIDPRQNLSDIMDTVERYIEVKNLDDGGRYDDDKKASLEELMKIADQGLKDRDTNIRHQLVLDAKPRDIADKIFFKIFDVKPNKDPNAWLNVWRAKSITVFLTKLSKFVLKALLKRFINLKLEQFAATKIDEHFRNGVLYDWFTDQIYSIYERYPDYRPVTLEEFKKTGIWERNAAKWRDRTRSQILKHLTDRSFLLIILLLVTMIPLPLASLYSIPARIILAYLGCRLAVGGSINTLVVDHEGNSLVLGVTFTRVGFELTNPELFVRRIDDGKLVRVDLPPVPRELYAISKDDLEDFERNEPTLKELKNEVMRNNES